MAQPISAWELAVINDAFDPNGYMDRMTSCLELIPSRGRMTFRFYVREKYGSIRQTIYDWNKNHGHDRGMELHYRVDLDRCELFVWDEGYEDGHSLYVPSIMDQAFTAMGAMKTKTACMNLVPKNGSRVFTFTDTNECGSIITTVNTWNREHGKNKDMYLVCDFDGPDCLVTISDVGYKNARKKGRTKSNKSKNKKKDMKKNKKKDSDDITQPFLPCVDEEGYMINKKACMELIAPYGQHSFKYRNHEINSIKVTVANWNKFQGHFRGMHLACKFDSRTKEVVITDVRVPTYITGTALAHPLNEKRALPCSSTRDVQRDGHVLPERVLFKFEMNGVIYETEDRPLFGRELAAFLHTTEEAIRCMCKRKKNPLPHGKFGKFNIFSLKVVTQFLGGFLSDSSNGQ